ncbi:MAG: DNA primase catalytic subunit PriS [Candidatus Micrarchaeota archaeon]|nr:DNA primase catalytic subunit PriS [Candidatus Micrarchaeota archaeon]
MFEPRELITRLVSSYYKNAPDLIPRKIEQREFGFGTFDAKVAGRHIAFENATKFIAYLTTSAPLFVSCSQAYYRYPAARPMEKKELLGAEMVFDIDATDMNLPCQLEHGKKWVCEICFDKVKEEAIKLVEDFLVPDFGFSENEIEINFSGNRGYHFHINSESVMHLDNFARREIGEYITGTGINFEEFFPTVGIEGTRIKKLMGPKPTEKGWQGKIANNFLRTLDSGVESLQALGMTAAQAKQLYEKRSLVQMGINSGNWDMVYIKKKDEFWKNVIAKQAIMQSDKIDKNVTADPTHLLRVPNTIHGDTGLIAKKVGSKSKLGKFDPTREAIAFKKGETKVHVTNSPKLILSGETFGPYKDEDVILPTYAGVYLHLKGVGKIKGFRISSKKEEISE